MKTVDPVTVEVIQNRLTQIGREAGNAMIMAAASLIVVGAKDLGFNINDHLGRTIVYSIWMPRHGTTLTYMLKASLEKFKDKGINPGDMILVNNPHDGALHALDLAVIAPVHYRGELIAWTGCATHHMDVRGMTPVLCPQATDWYQEGIIFRPIKIIEQGKLRDDIFDFFLDNVRVPFLQGLDLKAQIAANNVAKERIAALVDRYGAETLKACYEEIIAYSEAKTRERIKLLPSGKYDALEYLDYDKVYKLRCALLVEDDTLTFDFTGTDAEAGTFVNSASACTIANVHNIISCLLIPDIPSNEGSFAPIKINLPDKTVLSCKPPAPCSGASTIGGWKAQILAIKVLSEALKKSSEWRRANASWGSGFVSTGLSGIDQYGRPYVYTPMSEATMQGGGARATRDGFDVANIAGSTNTSIPNIEDIEQRYPFIYLKRGMSPDSGGPGKYRGGLAGEAIFKLYGVNKAACNLGYVGRECPADGFGGGQPGATSRVALKKDSNVKELLNKRIPDFGDIDGEEVVLPSMPAPFSVTDRDVFYSRCHGGGGYGDPYRREPAEVVKDVKEGYVSLKAAENLYGVVISPDSLELDIGLTEETRWNALESNPLC